MTLAIFDIANTETKLFKIVLLASMVFWFGGIIKGMWFGADQIVLTLDSISLAISVIVAISLAMSAKPETMAKVFCLAWIPMFVCYWKYIGGVHGAATYMYFSLLIIFLGILKGNTRLYTIVSFCLINLMLTLDAEAEILVELAPRELLINSLSFNYFFNSAIVALVVVYIKVGFDNEREEIEAQNQYLDRINEEISLKNELLSNQQLQIKTIQNNLEQLVHERTLELETRNRELQTYAYDNAHIVRRPLSNILSLLDIINQEDRSKTRNAQLREIRKKAKDLDEVVRKINMILN